MVSSGISGNIGVLPVTKNISGVADKNPDMDFGSFMAQSMSGTMDSDKPAPQPKTENIDVLADKMPKTSNRIQEKKYTQAKDSNSVDEKGETVNTGTDNGEVKAELQDAVSKVTDKIKEKFGVTDEEIEAALETLGMSAMDLLDVSQLTDFVVELTGSETAVDLLVSPKLTEGLNELISFVDSTIEEAADELGISVEELQQTVSEIAESEPVVQEEVIYDSAAYSVKEPEASEKSDKNVVSVETHEQTADATEEGTPDGVENAAEKTVKTVGKQQTSNESSSHTGHNDNTPDMTGNMVDKFAKAVEQAFEVREVFETVEPKQIIEQILESARINLNQEVTSMEMMLNPESLGKVNLNISVKEGVVTASFVTQNEVAREAIESQITVLKENFNQQGLKVEAVEVTVESHAFEANAGQEQSNAFNEQQEETRKKGQRQLRTDSLDDLSPDELTEGERIVLDMMVNEGNQVNFTA